VHYENPPCLITFSYSYDFNKLPLGWPLQSPYPHHVQLPSKFNQNTIYSTRLTNILAILPLCCFYEKEYCRWNRNCMAIHNIPLWGNMNEKQCEKHFVWYIMLWNGSRTTAAVGQKVHRKVGIKTYLQRFLKINSSITLLVKLFLWTLNTKNDF